MNRTVTFCGCPVLFLTGVCVVLGVDIKLGMLSPFRHPRLGWENNAAAATIALERARTQGLLAGHNVSVLWQDDQCSSSGGTAGTMKLHEQGVDVYIGPPCSSATVPSALLATYWNLPIFSQASSDPDLADKSVYRTLIRLGPPFNKMGKTLAAFFRQYNWTSVVVVSKRKQDNRNVFCDYSSRSVEEAFASNNIEISAYIQINEGISDAEIDNVLDRIKYRGRIILLCTEIIADRRRILLRAADFGMAGGDFVYILPDHLPPENIETPWIQDGRLDDKARLVYNSAFQISVADVAGPTLEEFRDLVSVKMAEPPWSYNTTLSSGLRGSVYSAYLHDVVYLYSLVLDEALTEGLDYRNGSLMFEKAKNKTFRGYTGTVQLDDNGDREPDYWIWDLRPDEDQYKLTMEVKITSSSQQNIVHHRSVVWETRDGLPPPSAPICGYNDELCPEDAEDNTLLIAVSLSVTVLVLAMLLIILGLRRHSRFERELHLQLWKIEYDQIKLTRGPIAGSINTISMSIILSNTSSESDNDDNQVFSKTGIVNGNLVAVKLLARRTLDLSRSDLKELKTMRDLRHENVNPFVGMCTDNRCPSIMYQYCSKGSLEDIIENDDIKLDWMFKVSLINDLTNGMAYLHSLGSASLCCHGNLKSSNCLVDNRWVLKVTDYGLSNIRNQSNRQLESSHRFQTGMFWLSPELLNIEPSNRIGSQKADIYAYGVVVFEILYRRLPYDTAIMTPLEIIRRVKRKERPPFRPTAMIASFDLDISSDEKIHSLTQRLLADCWEDNAELRPNFSTIKRDVAQLYVGKKLGIVDNMIKMLERYAVNLEGIVEQRTEQLMEEKKKTDALLYRMLPLSVTEQLKKGRVVAPEIFDSVTIFFSDIVGFTALSSESTPMQVVDFLNDLYTTFDNTIAIHDVYKVETIGDAYMAVSGLPVKNYGQHSVEIANMSLDLLKCAEVFHIRHKPGTKLQLRIGFHTGSCAAGVVGSAMPRYCLFGDTVNVASRMESTGEAMKIHISQSAKEALTERATFQIKLRGEIDIKGKGSQPTYWLCGRA